MSGVTIFVVLCAHITLCSACLAPPFIYGSECRSQTAVIGSPGHKLRYSVTVNGNAGTLVCCQGYSPASRSFVSIGCGHISFSRTVNWGNFIDNPKIKCRGSPLGASVSWDH